MAPKATAAVSKRILKKSAPDEPEVTFATSMDRGKVSAMLTALKYKSAEGFERKDKSLAAGILANYVGADDEGKRLILANFNKYGIKNLTWSTYFKEIKTEVDDNVRKLVTNFMSMCPN